MLDASPPQQLRSPQDVLGKIPFLLNYHPSDSIVTLYLGQQGRVLAYTNIGLEVPTPVAVDKMRDIVSHSAATLVLIVGYGPLTAAPHVTAVADAVHQHVRVISTFMVSVDRYYCLGNGCTCQAVTGIPFDPRATAIAAHSTVLGEVALPSRADLLALVAPDPTAHAAVQQAIRRAQAGPAPEPGALEGLLDQASHDQRLTDDETARMAVLLRHRRVRDAAWRATDDLMWQRDLWLDLTRRVPARYVTAPAALAAWCAWRRGENPLALAAARRAHATDPDDAMTMLVVTAIRSDMRPTDLIPVWPPAPDQPSSAIQA